MLLQTFPECNRFRELAENANVIPVCAEVLADTETPVSLLKRFYRGRGPVCLLESVEGGERWSRYSFLGISARATVQVYRDSVVINENGRMKTIPHGGKPLETLREIMKGYKPAQIPELPRFWGGLIGYFTYEAVSFFEPKIINKLPEDKPLASFMIPETVIIFDNIRKTMTVVSLAFKDANEDVDTLYHFAEERLKDTLSAIESRDKYSTPIQGKSDMTLKPLVEKDTFIERVEYVKEQIKAGEIIQCVISQPFVSDAPKDVISLYQAQRYINPSPYMYFIHLGGTVLIGSSPETMVRVENRTASLRPIAGTRQRGGSEQEDRRLADELLRDEKERAEHIMLVDLGRNDLGRVAKTGTVQVTDLMVVERYSHVMHLVSNVTCDIEDGYDSFDLFGCSFPAGTLSGAPKVRAMEIIAEMEDTPRGPYGGGVGYFCFSGNMDFAITIRTASIEDGKLTVQAGAGIVYDSVPESEYTETVNKAGSVQKALELLRKNQ
ncbi:Anthranilate synthase component 1 [Limihaloglobus sulfuriphilus]|uniref:Anthranilate synthase component 1 n=1 Tax=Limihaloglobus sulfuriphilus TaxID=1851148 RepID=A0A1Q2MEQ2_9BACT|nr:chorismate-binding protein [Limihaloglobus sulfuriphilus]AQQ70777.1 Anthranilate synthase component 1 [Limihaloglobus sulfuriphilus]